jgi:crotonobetainyl-CoA:carnitine CoA-transferase CaiB-like acyl-CoA transferase
VLHQSVAGKGPPVEGNRDELRAPHDVYRCLGASEWVAIAVEDDEQFTALARTIGRPELARHRRFSTLAARRLHADELDTVITTWTMGQDAGAAAADLRAAGVPAERVAHMNDLFGSVPLTRRRYFLEHDHPEVGIRQMAGTAWSSDRSPMSAATAAPCLGQHTRSVLERWLGLDAAAVELLDEAGVLS